jgi:uncharacterized protein (TIGR00369 family)
MNGSSTMTQAELIKQSILAMPVARTLGLQVLHLGEGRSEMTNPVAEAFSFRPGQLQATAIFAVADFAAVGAAATLLPAGALNATIEGTVKIVAPAGGDRLVARGRVVHASKLLTVCAADVYSKNEQGETLCATFLGTARNLVVAAAT